MLSRTLSARSARLAAATTVGVAAVATAALPAAAHVRVEPDTTTTGGYAGLTFRVPNESDTASTTRILLTLPQDKPLTHVSIKPVPGWTTKVTAAQLPTPVTIKGTTLTKAVRTITWSAAPGNAIAPGQYQELSITVGPLPAPGALVLPVAQTYSDGKVINWDQPQTGGQPEPEHPAPRFTITPADDPVPDPTAANATATRAAAPSGQPDGTARALAGAALAISLLGVGGQVISARRRGSGPA